MKKKSFDEWLASATLEVKNMSAFGQKLAYALYESNHDRLHRKIEQFKAGAPVHQLARA